MNRADVEKLKAIARRPYLGKPDVLRMLDRTLERLYEVAKKRSELQILATAGESYGTELLKVEAERDQAKNARDLVIRERDALRKKLEDSGDLE